MASVKQIQLTEKEVEEIAEDLDCGFRCFYHVEKKKYKSLIDRNHPTYEGEDETEAEWEEMDENRDDYVEFEKMDSTQSFEVMEEFAEKIENAALKKRLIRALQGRKPFRNFRSEIDESDYRNDWFSFKQAKNMEWVRSQAEDFNLGQQSK